MEFFGYGTLMNNIGYPSQRVDKRLKLWHVYAHVESIVYRISVYRIGL